MSHLLETGLFVLDFARKATDGFLTGIEGDAFYTLFAEGGGNAAYIVGHIALTDDMTLHMLAGRDLIFNEAEQKLFGGGAEPTAIAADYPPQAELMQKYTDVRAALIEFYKGMSDDELVMPVEGDWAQFGDTRAKLMTSLAWHEAMHAGQLTVIRRQLAMPRVFG